MTGKDWANRLRAKLTAAAPTLAGLAENVAGPIITYLVVRSLGATDVVALLVSAAVSVVILGLTWWRTGEIHGLGALVLLRFALSLVMAFIWNDARWLLIKDSVITGIIGVVALLTLLTSTPMIERIRADLSPDRASFDGRLESDGNLRRVHRRLTALWGVALIADAVIETIIILSVPVPVAVVVTNVVGPCVIVGLVAFTEWSTRRVTNRDAVRSGR